MTFDNRLRLYLVLMASFCTALVVGDVIGGKLTQVTVLGHAFTISVGMIPFPITFLLTDLLNEFYGKKAAKTVTWIGFAMAMFAFLIISVAVQIPFAAFTFESGWKGMNQASFDNVFSGAQRIFFASMVAYLAGQFIDITIFHALKRRAHNRYLWLRATGSTVVSQLIDTCVVQTIAWFGIMTFPEIVNIAFSSYVVKVSVAVGLTPVIYAGHLLVERWFQIPPVTLDEHGDPIDRPSLGQ